MSESEGFLRNSGVRFPSRFIFNIDKKLIKYNVKLPTELIDKSKELIDSSEANLYRELPKAQFNKGDCIAHDILGIGIINDINSEKYAYIIKFDNSQTERTISFDNNLHLVKKNQLKIKNNKAIDITKDKEENKEIKIEYEDLLSEQKEKLELKYKKLMEEQEKKFKLEKDEVMKEHTKEKKEA